jgi:cysteine synthase A
MSRKSLCNRLPDRRFDVSHRRPTVDDADRPPPGSESLRRRREKHRDSRNSHRRAEVGRACIVAEITVRPGNGGGESLDARRPLDPICNLPPDPLLALLCRPQKSEDLAPRPATKVLDHCTEHPRRHPLLRPTAARMEDEASTGCGPKAIPVATVRHLHTGHGVHRRTPPGHSPNHLVHRMFPPLRAGKGENRGIRQALETSPKSFVSRTGETQSPAVSGETGDLRIGLLLRTGKQGIDLPAVQGADHRPGGKESRHLGRGPTDPQLDGSLRREQAQGGLETNRIPQGSRKEEQSRRGRSFPLHGGFVTIIWMPAPNFVAQSPLDLIGSTAAVQITRLLEPGSAEVWAKLELSNLGGSVKDRICLQMIEEAERSGRLRPGDVVVEPTSGNTGIGLALVCAVKGYRLILTMPDTMSEERRSLLRAYGAELELTPDDRGMGAAIARAKEIAAAEPRAFMPGQFDNPSNPNAHRHTTAPEILEQFPQLDAFVAGVGTGGTITGVGETLHEARPGCLIVAVEPSRSPVLSGGEAGFHDIQGIGAGFVPGNLHRDAFDRIIAVDDDAAISMSRRLAKEEGLLVGISSGANCVAALEIARELGEGKTVLTIFCDTGERYLTTDLFRESEKKR